jgi:hypothetical protein
LWVAMLEWIGVVVNEMVGSGGFVKREKAVGEGGREGERALGGVGVEHSSTLVVAGADLGMIVAAVVLVVVFAAAFVVDFE